MFAGGRRFERQPLEKRRIANISGVFVPREPLAQRDREAAPPIVAVEHRRVLFAEHVRLHGLQHRLLDLPLARPDVPEIDRAAAAVPAERLRCEIDLHLPRKRIGHDQGRRGEIVRPDLRLNSPFEVAIAAEHRRHDQVLVAHEVGYRLGQRTAVADARRAAVADDIEPELREVFEKP